MPGDKRAFLDGLNTEHSPSGAYSLTKTMVQYPRYASLSPSSSIAFPFVFPLRYVPYQTIYLSGRDRMVITLAESETSREVIKSNKMYNKTLSSDSSRVLNSSAVVSRFPLFLYRISLFLILLHPLPFPHTLYILIFDFCVYNTMTGLLQYR
ncbi:hypothetical protein BDN72DRAFT_403380 [Pluteus cervinus]|uniref:Uncharacterized protein n=1 Tax=Pluteus cervinus TaxID=181527 RepID=A0ACD3A931_9AGAR|nr:hypothetical protein BDN72DRAFT_403380 [Pluteus cervinus]